MIVTDLLSGLGSPLFCEARKEARVIRTGLRLPLLRKKIFVQAMVQEFLEKNTLENQR